MIRSLRNSKKESGCEQLNHRSTQYDTSAILIFITRRFGLVALRAARRYAGNLSNALGFGRR